MSDIGLPGMAEFVGVILGIVLLLALAAGIPLAIWLMERAGVKISPGVRKSARALTIASGVGAGGLLLYLPAIWS